MKFTYITLIFCILSSCSAIPTPAEPKENQMDTFFSLANFIDKEVAQLNAEQPALIKSVQMNGKTEEKTLQGVDFAAELAIFRQADINRKAWQNKYLADTISYNGHLQKISYEALDSDLKTQNIEIDFDATGSVEQLVIKSERSTFLAGNTTWLKYNVGQGYSIKTEQKNRAAETVEVFIEGNWSN